MWIGEAWAAGLNSFMDRQQLAKCYVNIGKNIL